MRDADKHKWRDVAWKEALGGGARNAIEYFMPDLAADMDPSRDVTTIIGQELHPAGADSDKGMRSADVFLDVPLLGGENGNVALFIESQHEDDESFALRMFETYVRLREKRRVKTTGLAIFTGNAKDVNTYFDSCYGFKVSVEYNTFHLPSKNLEELRRDKRPFARVALAGRLSLDAGGDLASR